ncbi:hypothetical protein X777_11804, partial [Ooceraea biroi]
LRERLRKALEKGASRTANDQNGDGTLTTGDHNLEALSKDELKRRLRKLGLPISGLKAVLRERLKAALQKSESDDDETDSKEDEIEETRGEEARRESPRDNARETDGAFATPGPATPARVRRMRYIDRIDTTMMADNDRARCEYRDRPKTVLTFKDVEDVLTTFSGDGTQSVRR